MKRTCTGGEKGCGRGRGGGGGGRRGEDPSPPQPPYETLIVQDSKLAWGASFCCSNWPAPLGMVQPIRQPLSTWVGLGWVWFNQSGSHWVPGLGWVWFNRSDEYVGRKCNPLSNSEPSLNAMGQVWLWITSSFWACKCLNTICMIHVTYGCIQRMWPGGKDVTMY